MTERNDVQLEHGHVRIANRLLEAMLDAQFTGTQLRILMGLARLTYGWRRRTVAMSHQELAAYLQLSGASDARQASGGFRRALADLIRNGVVLQVAPGGGGTRATYAVQKDFTRWGAYSVAPARLAAIYGTRPHSDDALLGQHAEPDMPSEPDPREAGGLPPDPTGSEGMTPQGQDPCPARVTPTPDNPPQGNGLPARKDNERQERQTALPSSRAGGDSPPIAGAVVGPIAQLAIALTATANRAIAERWGEQVNVLMHTAPPSHEAAERVLEAGVDVELARSSIAAQCARSKKARPPATLTYFVPGILEDAERAAAREQARASPEPAPLPERADPSPRRDTRKLTIGERVYLKASGGHIP